jgi:3-oxoadipate enol-lactonase
MNRANRSPSGLAYTVDGPEGAPVIVLGSSLGTTHDMWSPQIEGVGALTDRFRVVRYDHLGHGESEVPNGPYSLADLGERVAVLVGQLPADLGVDSVVLGGLSLGGMVAQWVGAHRPEHLRGLILCCTSAHMPPAGAWLERAELVRAEGTGAVAEAVVARWFTPGFADARPGIVEWALAMLHNTPDEGYAACAEALATMDLRSDLAKISVPTLIIAGADDPATPPAQAEAIAAGIGAGIGAGRSGPALPRLEVLADAAHLATVQQSAAASALIADFLEDLS